MIGDNNGQVSLEYLLIFAISIAILIVFTLPLTEQAIEDTLDVSTSLDVKNDLSKITQAIEKVYGEGQGSKQTVNIITSKKVKIYLTDNHMSCRLKLKSGSYKTIDDYYESNLGEYSITLNKGENVLIVEWPENSENMLIYQ
ncbi:class III signal peptide-containing protein [Methanobrevibacter sp.]|uniref:class III signal peptide-containing protein n=1 Tax=Methanobrevibacter sp. TaxID=66852 RepID=UPI00388FA2BC